MYKHAFHTYREKNRMGEKVIYLPFPFSARFVMAKELKLEDDLSIFPQVLQRKYERSEHNIRLFYKRKQCFNKISISMIIIWVWKLSPSIVSSIWFDVLWVMRHFSIYLSTWICTYFKKSILGPDWSVCNL